MGPGLFGPYERFAPMGRIYIRNVWSAVWNISGPPNVLGELVLRNPRSSKFCQKFMKKKRTYGKCFLFSPFSMIKHSWSCHGQSYSNNSTIFLSLLYYFLEACICRLTICPVFFFSWTSASPPDFWESVSEIEWYFFFFARTKLEKKRLFHSLALSAADDSIGRARFK